ncbi:TM0106 family RecB-like putative nuclease [Candidatus Woesearchaeota archaeon]|nr:TM0106 family RecB-like putative nuclease [Candidatus Woesearchaeota archaeon]
MPKKSFVSRAEDKWTINDFPQMDRDKLARRLPPITATHFYNLHSCPTRVYLDMHGDHYKRLPLSEFLRQKIAEGVEHERSVLSGLPDLTHIDYETDQEGLHKTLDAMRAGASIISQGVLVHEGMVGRPDLLIRDEGVSIFGPYQYYACDIKSGRSVKFAYQLQVAFYSDLLGKTQGTVPTRAGVILHDGKERRVDLLRVRQRFEEAKQHITSIRDGVKDHPHLCAACKECGWRAVCKEELLGSGDLSLINGLSREYRAAYYNIGIKDITELSQSAVKPSRISQRVADNFRVQARSLIEHSPVLIHKIELPSSQSIIYFDIEGETEQKIYYLLGCLLVQDGVTTYHPFFAEKPSDERQMWNAFLTWIKTIPDFHIIHYHNYEKYALAGLRRKYGCPDELYKTISSHMTDLFKLVKDSIAFPIHSYSIKDLAKSIGFCWRSDTPGGAQSLYWYAIWAKTGDASIKEALLHYNEDDCQAMKHVVEHIQNSFNT